VLFPAKFFARAEDVTQRTALCEACEHKALKMCLRCGCFIPSKVRFAQTKCPEGRWGTVDGIDLIQTDER